MKGKNIGWTIGLAGLVAACAGGAHAGITITPIASLGGSHSIALDINDHGVIVGQATLPGDEIAHAYIWENGVTTDLGAIDSTVNSTAWAINNNNEVVGWSDNPSGFGSSAFYWHNGGALNLGAAMGASSSTAWDINDQGVIVGQGNLGPGFAKGFVYTKDTGGVVAGTLSGYMGGGNLGINNRGEIVGHSFFFGDPSVANRALPGDRGYTAEQIGPDGYNFSIASDINDSGTIVGWSQNGPGTLHHAAIFSADRDHTIIDLGTLEGFGESEANAINSAGIIVGVAYPLDPKGYTHAWVYADGQMTDLNTLLPTRGGDIALIINALGINSEGDIVGTALTHDGLLTGFVLSGFVPAPGASTLGALALAFAAQRRRRA